MLRFLSKLARPFQKANKARAPRRTPRRPMLGLEGLEDRMALSTASLTGSTLLVNASPGSFVPPAGSGLPIVGHIRAISIQQDVTNPARLEVMDSGKVLGTFPIGSIKAIDIHVAGLDSVTVDDRIVLGIIHPGPQPQLPSLTAIGGPVAFPGLNAINISGHGSLNSFTLERSALLPAAVPPILAGGAQAGSPVGPSVSVTLNRHSGLGLSL